MTFGLFFALTIWILAHIILTFNAVLIKSLTNLKTPYTIGTTLYVT